MVTGVLLADRITYATQLLTYATMAASAIQCATTVHKHAQTSIG